MKHFEKYGGGRFVGPITEKAEAFADGDDDRLAAVALVKWMRENAIPFTWSQDDPTSITTGADQRRSVARAVRGETTELHPANVYGDVGVTWYVRLESNLAAILGCTSSLEESVPPHRLLTPQEWLRLFPHHWLPRAALEGEEAA